MLRCLRISMAGWFFLGLVISAGAQGVRTGGLENYCLNMPVEASTNASPEGDKYYCTSAVDGNISTHWASADKAQPPQWLQVNFDERRTIDAVVIVQVNMPNLYTNAENVELSFSAGDPIQATLEDTPESQVLRFEPRETEFVRLTILSSYGFKHYLGVEEIMAYRDPDQKVRPIVSPTTQWKSIDLTAHGREQHPCVNKTPADVQQALDNIQKYTWAKNYVEGVKKAADEWLEKSDEWFLAHIPEPGACFAYGFTGCPICGAHWGTWGGARCSFDNPGHVTCANGHVLPDADHPDPGTGYVAPDGRIHYFVGSYNAWVVETLQFKVLQPLCMTYLLTGEEKYAEKAAVILDGLAAIYPSCDKGSWDYPSHPPSGRFCRPWYQVARVLVHYVDWYDEILNSPALDQPSVTEGMTRRRNIEENLLKNGAWYCYEQSLKGGLNNGEADYIRGALAVGCVLGIDSYVDWALDGPYGIRSIIANNADRDGRYFETSIGYALHARNLYLTFSEPMLDYRSQKYPEGINLYQDRKFLSFYFLPQALFDCAGHMPRYGDTGPDTGTTYPSHPLFSTTDYRFAERLYARTAGELREPFAAALAYLAGGRGEKVRDSNRDQPWMLFHAAEFPGTDVDVEGIPLRQGYGGQVRRRVSSTDFFGQKGIAILRGGEGTEAQAALVRFGQSLNHGHHDDLNLNYYALGKEVTYDLGYGLGSTHTQVGWSKQTASHNLVVVNETSQHSGGGGSGGSLFLCDEMPGVRVLEAEAHAAYLGQGVEQYRRMVALIGEGSERYLVDIFRVRGGEQHDYMFHASSDQMALEGAKLGEVEPGSLAGPDIRWGDKQGNDGDLIGFPNKPYWNPPPGNGYGFLVNVRRGAAPGPWSATWEIDAARDAHLRLLGLPEPDTQVITAWAPGIYPRLPKAAYVCARRQGEGLQSVFASVIEPYSAEGPKNAIRAMDIIKTAKASSGTIKLVSSLNVVLFQAEKAGDRMTFTASVPAEGDYQVTLGHYLSPAYGAARLLIDGQRVGEQFRGTAGEVARAKPVSLGQVHLAAGEHALALELVEPDGEAGHYWMGITFVALDPAEQATERQPAAPRIEAAERLVPDAEGALGLRISGTDGIEDYVFSALDDARRTYDEGFVVAAPFARMRTDAQGQVLQANVIGGPRLTGRGLTIELQPSAWTATVVEVDEANREVVLDAVLPDDGRLTGAAVYFSNPEYSRNTAYHVDRISVADGRSRLRVRESSFILGKAVVEDDPIDAHTISSLVPHDYARPMGRPAPPEADFFAGKLLQSNDGAFETIVRQAIYAQPLQIKVDSAKGVVPGQELFYWDLRPGDRVLIQAHATLTRVGGEPGKHAQPMRYLLDANAAARLSFASKNGGDIYYRTNGGAWQVSDDGLIPAEAVASGGVEVRIGSG